MQRLINTLKSDPEIIMAMLLAVFAFSLRYWLLCRFNYPLMLHEQDGIAYMSIAHDLMKFNLPQQVYKPPFYPLIIALFSILPVHLEMAARIASIAMDSLIVLPLYGLSQTFLSKKTSLLVCFLWSTFSFALFFSPSPLSLSTYLCMLLAGAYSLYLALRTKGRMTFFAGSGAMFACAYLSRTEGFVSLFIGVLLILVCVFRDHSDRKDRLKGVVWLLLTFILVSLPYLLLLKANLGYWTFTAKTLVAIKGIDGALTIDSGNLGNKNGITIWLDQFGGLTGGVKFIGNNIAEFSSVLFRTFPSWMHFFALGGIFYALSRRDLLRLFSGIFPLLVTFTICVANLPKVNSYIYPLYPIYLLFFVAGLQSLVKFVTGWIETLWNDSRKVPAVIPGILLAAVSSVAAVSSYNKAIESYQAPAHLFQVNKTVRIFKAAGEDVRSLSAPHESVMTLWGLVSYFAGRPMLGMPKGGVEEVLAAGRKGGAAIVLIDTEAVSARRQELSELLGPLYGREIDEKYGVKVIAMKITDVGGYVIYRYI